jgi:hypothetical protein
MELDKPLDEIIAQERSKRRTSRGRGRGAARGGSVGRGAARGAGASSTGPIRNKHTGGAAAAAAAGPAASAPGKPIIPLMADGSKIIVSNLPIDVTENQIRVRRNAFQCLPLLSCYLVLISASVFYRTFSLRQLDQ